MEPPALGPPEPTLPCLEPHCIRRFYNRTGRSNHMRSQHPQFVPDLQQQANAPTSIHNDSSQMSSPPTDNMSVDSRTSSSQSRGSDRNNHNIADSDELPVDDGGEYQHLNDGNRSESPEPSNASAGSYDQAHNPVPAVPCIKIINGGFLVLLIIFHIYSRIHFQG